VVNWDGVLKSSNRLEGDRVTHFKGWIKSLITRNLVLKCSYVDDRIKGRPMMRVSFAMDGNRQKGKQLIIKHKTLKWAKENITPPKGSP
jgi:hypothetical protein